MEMINKSLFIKYFKIFMYQMNFTFATQEEKNIWCETIYNILNTKQVSNQVFIYGMNKLILDFKREDFITRPSGNELYEKVFKDIIYVIDNKDKPVSIIYSEGLIKHLNEVFNSYRDMYGDLKLFNKPNNKGAISEK